MSSFKDLRAWQQAMSLAKLVYSETEALPRSELFGLTSQLRRASFSIPANIAEGYGRVGRGEYLKHLGYSSGSLNELETGLLLAQMIGYEMHYDLLFSQVMSTGAPLHALIKKLKVSDPK